MYFAQIYFPYINISCIWILLLLTVRWNRTAGALANHYWWLKLFPVFNGHNFSPPADILQIKVLYLTPQMQNFSSPQRQILLLADSGSPAQPHCGFAAATELCIFPNVTHKHVILQTFSSRCSTGRQHNRWAWNRHVLYFPVIKHTAKVVTYSIQPKLQHKFQAPSHTRPVYSRTEAWIHPSCHHEHMLTRSTHRARDKALWKHKDNLSINQRSWSSQVSKVCNMRHVNTPSVTWKRVVELFQKRKRSHSAQSGTYTPSSWYILMPHNFTCSRKGKKQNPRVCRNTSLQHLPV